MTNPIRWPEGKSFAFTIFDDTDLQTEDNVKPVYSFLSDMGFRTTKSVWPVKGTRQPKIGGITCQDEEYLEWVLELQKQGFELALHNVTYHTSTRRETAVGLDTFYRLFGHHPHSHANHSGCDESIYWGPFRLSGINRFVYNLLLRNKYQGVFIGHLAGSPLFWGDLCRDKIRYVRNFVFNDINTLKMCPFMPYHDRERPYVNYWFAASEGADVNSFNATLKEENQDRLSFEGGACIMYTHFACGFSEQGVVNERFRTLMERIRNMNGWFVPVQTLLDYILAAKGHRDITQHDRNKLERQWLRHKIYQSIKSLLTHGTNTNPYVQSHRDLTKQMPRILLK